MEKSQRVLNLGPGIVQQCLHGLTLAPWDERTRTQDQIVQDVNAAAAKVPALRGNVSNQTASGSVVPAAAADGACGRRSHEKLTEAAIKIVDQLGSSDQLLQTPRLDNEPTQAQISVTIDRERASVGVDINAIGTSLQALLEGRSVTDVFIDGNRSRCGSSPARQPINDPTDLENIFLTTSDGRVVPMSTIAHMEDRAVAPQLNREQQLAFRLLIAGLNDGVALGDAVEAVKAIAEPLLPPGSALCLWRRLPPCRKIPMEWH